MLLGVASVAAIITVPAFPAGADAPLTSGGVLWPGWTVTTPGSGCYVEMQSGDGNVVEYCPGPEWWTSTNYNPGAYLYMQGDGNLVVYRSDGAVLWNSHTQGFNGASMWVQDDHNVVIYDVWGTPIYAKSWLHDPNGSRTYASQILFQWGWSSASQFPCLNNLWNRESGWRWNADNPSSSAYGIPQSLPGSKMAAAGPDWHNNGLTQIQWGLGYIAGRYGNPCNAWAHSQNYGWY